MNKKIIVGVIAAAIVAVGVLVGISLLGGDDDGSTTIEGVADVRERFADLPQSGNTVGQADAPVEIIEYGDISCPACKAASEDTIPEIIDSLVVTGEAKLTFRPIAFINRSSERGALGAEAAALQDAMWPFVEALYLNQGSESDQDWLTDGLMEDIAGQLGLDVDKWTADYGSEPVASTFFARSEAAAADKVSATPTFVVVGPRGRRTVEGVANLSQFEDAIAEVGPAT